MIVVATLLCDYKYEGRMLALPTLLKMTGDLTFYVNIETSDTWSDSMKLSRWTGVFSTVHDAERPSAWDVWRRNSAWHQRSYRDQDQSRLEPICVARNMARAFAIASGATHLCFIDADVVPDQLDGIERLAALDWPLVGGLVPGRGAHSGARYLFWPQGRDPQRPNVERCGHGTLGYSLIRRDLFEVLPFRYGPHIKQRDVQLSEDPCFAADAMHLFGVPYWLIDMTVTARHLDAPGRELKLEEADNSYVYSAS